MSTKIEGHSSDHDVIEDIIESSSSSSKAISSLLKDNTKILQNKNYLNYSSLPSLYNKTKFEQQIDNSTIILPNEIRDRLHLILPRSNSSSIIMSNDERRKEIDLIIKHLYDGKLLSVINDDHAISDISESSINLLNKGSTVIIKNIEENKNNLANIDLLSIDDDITSLQRELQEKELDVIHLHKEIQELQLENKLLKAKVPTIYSNGHISNNNEIEIVLREKDILQNELRLSQELIAKFEQQQHQNIVINRSNKIDEIILQQKDLLEKKLRSYEKQMRLLTNENDQLKQDFHQSERIITQIKRENDELQQKINETKKQNDELFYQEFNSLRNDLKILKQRNNELFQDNLRLQQQLSSSFKISNIDSKHFKITRSESPNISEASDSTNYLTTVNVEQYNSRPLTSINHSEIIDKNNQHHTKKSNRFIKQEDIHRNNYLIPSSKSVDQHLNYRSLKTKHTFEWNNENIQTNGALTDYDDDRHSTNNSKSSSRIYRKIHSAQRYNESQNHSQRIINNNNNNTNNQQDNHQQIRRNNETTRRPYAPSSIADIHLNDIIKFSRPGGKISKGIVKYIGSLPGKTDQYLGLELENEESKHDGVYQDHRLFQCTPNKGVFVGFNKIIMAWREK